MVRYGYSLSVRIAPPTFTVRESQAGLSITQSFILEGSPCKTLCPEKARAVHTVYYIIRTGENVLPLVRLTYVHFPLLVSTTCFPFPDPFFCWLSFHINFKVVAKQELTSYQKEPFKIM